MLFAVYALTEQFFASAISLICIELSSIANKPEEEARLRIFKTKNELDNISKAEERDFKKLAKFMFALTDKQIDALLASKKIEEVKP